MEIRQQWEGEATELFREGAVGVNTVDADAQNLSISRFETRVVGLESSQFGLSATGKVEDIKGQHHMCLAPVVRQAYFIRPRRSQSELGRGLPDVRYSIHAHSSLAFNSLIRISYEPAVVARRARFGAATR